MFLILMPHRIRKIKLTQVLFAGWISKGLFSDRIVILLVVAIGLKKSRFYSTELINNIIIIK